MKIAWQRICHTKWILPAPIVQSIRRSKTDNIEFPKSMIVKSCQQKSKIFKAKIRWLHGGRHEHTMDYGRPNIDRFAGQLCFQESKFQSISLHTSLRQQLSQLWIQHHLTSYDFNSTTFLKMFCSHVRSVWKLTTKNRFCNFVVTCMRHTIITCMIWLMIIECNDIWMLAFDWVVTRENVSLNRGGDFNNVCPCCAWHQEGPQDHLRSERLW